MQYIFAALILITAGFIQGLSGMGYAMFVTALLPIFFPFKEIVVCMGGFGLITGTVTCIKNRKYIQYSALLPVLLGVFVGTSIGFIGFVKFDTEILTLIFGFTVAAVSVFMLKTSGKFKLKINAFSAVSAGAVSGLFGAACNVPGPPVAIYMMNAFPDDKNKYYATVSACFWITALYKNFLYITSGMLDLSMLNKMIAIVIPSLCGFLIGRKLFHRVNSRTIFKVVYYVMLAIGTWLIISKYI